MRARAVTLAGLAALVISACGGSSTDGGTGSLPADLDPLQREILDDGDVTHAEMERSLEAVMECMRDQGYDAELLLFEAGQASEYRYGDPAGDIASADAAFRACQDRLLSVVQVRYQVLHGPSREEVQAHWAEVISCLEDAGHDVQGLPFEEVALEVPLEALNLCDA